MYATVPCPPWCTVDHSRRNEEMCDLRECASASTPIPTLTHATMSAEAVRFVDLVSGRIHDPEVRIGDDTFSVPNALRFAAEVMNAADLAAQ